MTYAMNNCTNCGAPLSPGDNFCMYCGSPVVSAPVAPANGGWAPPADPPAQPPYQPWTPSTPQPVSEDPYDVAYTEVQGVGAGQSSTTVQPPAQPIYTPPTPVQPTAPVQTHPVPVQPPVSPQPPTPPANVAQPATPPSTPVWTPPAVGAHVRALDEEDYEPTVIAQSLDDEDYEPTVVVANERYVLVRRSNGERIELELPCMLGRGSDAESRVRGNRSVSRRHAKVYYEGETLAIQDLGSSNGTYVDDVRLEGDTSVALRDGAVVRLGDEDFTFTIETM